MYRTMFANAMKLRQVQEFVEVESVDVVVLGNEGANDERYTQ